MLNRIREYLFYLFLQAAVCCSQPMLNVSNLNDKLQPANPKTFTARVPIHLLPSNTIVDYFDWDIQIGLRTCPFTGMLVRARRGGPLSLQGEEDIEDLVDLPSPHCSVECECMNTGDYRCKSLCLPPPRDADFCVPVAVPGQCCHKYVCDDEIDIAFPNIVYFPEPKNSTSGNSSSRTTLMCTPGDVLPDSLCHLFFPKAFLGNLGPKGVCFGFDDIRCALLNEDKNVTFTPKNADFSSKRQRGDMQTMFFRIENNGTIFPAKVPVKKVRRKL